MELSESKDAFAADRNTENRTLSFKWRLQRIHSSLRSSFHSKKRDHFTNSLKGNAGDIGYAEEHRIDSRSGCDTAGKRFVIDGPKRRRESLTQNKHGLSTAGRSKQSLSTVNGNLPSEKTLLDGGSLDKQKSEDRKLWSDNEVIYSANDASFREQFTDRRTLDTVEGSKGWTQNYNHRRENNNTRAPIARAKSLNKLVSLFRRSGNSDKGKYDRGKKLPSANSEVSLPNTRSSSTTSANLETPRIGSTSTLDSLSDSECYLAKDHKYRSLRRSKASPLYPTPCSSIQRSFSLDDTLAPFDDTMGEKSRTVAELTPSIRVEEFVERCAMGTTSSDGLDFGSSGSVSIDARLGAASESASGMQLEKGNNHFADDPACRTSQRKVKQLKASALHSGAASRSKWAATHACETRYRAVSSDIGPELGDLGGTAESASQTESFVDRESNYSDNTTGSSMSPMDWLRQWSGGCQQTTNSLGRNGKGGLHESSSRECVDGSPTGGNRLGGFEAAHNSNKNYCENCEALSHEHSSLHRRERNCGAAHSPFVEQPNGLLNHADKETPSDKFRDDRSGCVNSSESGILNCSLLGQTALSASHIEEPSPSGLHQHQGQAQRGGCCSSVDAPTTRTENRYDNENRYKMDDLCVGMETDRDLGDHSLGTRDRSGDSPVNRANGHVHRYCQCCGQCLDPAKRPVTGSFSSPRPTSSGAGGLQVLPWRQRSTSALSPRTEPQAGLQLVEENRSCSCSQLHRRTSSASTTNPPPVRPRIQSLEKLSADAAQVIMRKKRSFIEKARIKHAASLDLPSVDETLTDKFFKNKRHSYGGGGDTLEPPATFLRSRSSEGFLENAADSTQSLETRKSSLGGSSLFSSIRSLPASAFSFEDVSIGRSRSVPGFFGVSDVPQTSPIPEEMEWRFSQGSVQWSEASFGSPGHPRSRRDSSRDEMDAPEAFAEALWDHVTMDQVELSFKAGDIITVISMTSCDWWYGQVHDREGWFPAPFVRIRVSQTLAGEEVNLAPLVRTRKGTNEGFLSDDDVRSRVVDEILSTERDYVKNLRDVVEGYLKQARVRPDMFTNEQIAAVFCNIEQVYAFHQQLLQQLEECYQQHDSKASLIGSVFLNNKGGFEIYSEYCNNHPHAVLQLKTLCEHEQYKQFFEACRLLREMISIPLDGFLLTPVQKICKYPLQLAELLKHTIPTHKDYVSVKEALKTMKEVASSINEHKRKVECINKIAKWQSTIEGWEGENVLSRSSELIHSGDVVTMSRGTSHERVLFLFDHQLIYCKKDMLKKNNLTYKGRIDTDLCKVVWLKDGEDSCNGSVLVNAWKIIEPNAADKSLVMFTKKAEQLRTWMKAFAEEKRRKREDARAGFVISQETRLAAMKAAQCSIKNKKIIFKKEKVQKSQSTCEIRPPPSPTLRLPAAVSSADLKENGLDKENGASFLRGGVIRRSLNGLRGSKRNKEKRMSSVF